MPSATLHRWSDIPAEQMNPLFTRQYIVGTNTMLARVTFKKGAKVPEHHHIHEQISFIAEGVVVFRVDGKDVTLRAGEVLCIPPNVPHELAETLEDTISIEVFNPPREDWIAGNDAYLRTAVAGKS